ncbi:MAG: AEC family transporter [Lawsonibacter sp.]|nr:AEC family transporter [Lawsonibacter sp.]
MAGFFNALSACLVLLMLMAVGYFMGARGWMTAREKGFVSKYIINIAVPCNCIVGLLDNLDRSSLMQAGGMVATAILSVVITVLASAGVAMLLRLPHGRWGVFVAMAGFSNTLFIGIPVCTQLFGETSMPYIMLYYIGHTALMQSVGVMLVERAGAKPGQKGGIVQFLRDVFLKPPILSVIFSVLMLTLGWKLPNTLMRFANYISGSVSPLALIYCGFIVYEVGLKNLRFLRGLPIMLVMRLAIAPIISLSCCSLLGMEGLALQVFVVESALPVVSQVTVMAGAFGADEEYAATGACLSILGSFITIPVLMLVLGG